MLILHIVYISFIIRISTIRFIGIHGITILTGRLDLAGAGDTLIMAMDGDILIMDGDTRDMAGDTRDMAGVTILPIILDTLDITRQYMLILTITNTVKEDQPVQMLTEITGVHREVSPKVLQEEIKAPKQKLREQVVRQEALHRIQDAGMDLLTTM